MSADRPKLSRWSALAVVILVLLLSLGAVGLLLRVLAPTIGMMHRALNTTWTVVDASTLGTASYADLNAELISSPYSVRSGVFYQSPTLGAQVTEMQGVFRPCAADSRMVVVVLVPNRATSPDLSSRIGMFVEVQCLIQSSGGVLLPMAGTHAVRAELTPQQAAKVLAADVPQCLVDALVSQAQALHWQPQPTPDSPSPSPMTQVNPAPCFPAALP